MKTIVLRYTHSQRGSAVAFLKALHEEFTGRFRYRISDSMGPTKSISFFNWVATRRREHITFSFYMKDLLSPSTTRTMWFTDEFLSKVVQKYVFVIQHNESVNEYEPQSDSVILTEEQLLTLLRANTKVQQNPMDYFNKVSPLKWPVWFCLSRCTPSGTGLVRWMPSLTCATYVSRKTLNTKHVW